MRDQQIVPDEAYTLRIEASVNGTRSVYDANASSGGDRVNPWDLSYSATDGLIAYALPKACRVLVRSGIENGPVLKNVLNWEPRTPGLCSEVWNGWDEQRTRRFSEEPMAQYVVQAYGLADNSIIAFGNKATDYRSWYLEHGSKLNRRPEAARPPELERITSPHWSLPKHLDKDLRLQLSFPQAAGTVEPGKPFAVAEGGLLVRVDAPDAPTREFLMNQRFEFVAFVDDVRLAEEEMSMLPYNWHIDTSGLDDGEHWFTVNLVTFQQHVGTASQRISIGPKTGAVNSVGSGGQR